MKTEFVVEAANGSPLAYVDALAGVVKLQTGTAPGFIDALTPDEAWDLADALKRAAHAAVRLEIDAQANSEVTA